MHAEGSGSMGAAAADREIVISRFFNASRALVFKAWTDPEHVHLWWGPNGFTTTVNEMDVRPEGVWSFVMHSPDGVDFENRIVFIEVDAPERLVYDHGDREGEPAHFRVTLEFDQEGDGTRLTMTSVFPTAEARDYVVREFRAIEGGNQTLDRLEAFLAQGAA